ncbi:MAG: uracil-DNA glycosylase [Dehalococcoidia bacterium]|nr:uracil-DNA glycosylase [Dehalococcoidia bacterium]
MDTLADLARRVSACTDCPLHTGRTNAVPGEGPSDAEILFIGEGPGFHEDRQGRPFVGPAGNFLEDLLQSIGMTREQVFIANMVKCRPPENRDPTPAEISACSKYLDRQIELLNPLLIVTLGRFSTAKFVPGQAISRVRGRLHSVGGRRVFPIMHPAAGLRRQEMRAGIEEDFAKIPGLLDVLRIQADPASETVRRVGEPSHPSYETGPPAQTPSLWDIPEPTAENAPVPPESDSVEQPPAPPEPPPGQQRLF